MYYGRLLSFALLRNQYSSIDFFLQNMFQAPSNNVTVFHYCWTFTVNKSLHCIHYVML